MYCLSPGPAPLAFATPVPLPRRRKPVSSPELSLSSLDTEPSPGLAEEGQATDLVMNTDQGLVGLIEKGQTGTLARVTVKDQVGLTEEGQTLDLVLSTDQGHESLVEEGQSGALARVSTQDHVGLSMEEVRGRGTANFDELNARAV